MSLFNHPDTEQIMDSLGLEKTLTKDGFKVWGKQLI